MVVVRRRRHPERGGERPRRLGRAALGPARRLHQRRVPDARHPDRRGRRHRAPAAAGGRSARRGGSTWAASTAATSSSRAASGIDAEATRWVDDHAAAEVARRRPDLHATRRCAATSRDYRGRPAALRGRGRTAQRVEGVSAIVQNSDPYTYFRTTPAARLRGHRDRRRHALADRHARAPTSCGRAGRRSAGCSHASGRLAHHRQASSFPRVHDATRPVARRRAPLPLQVDGDYIGHAPRPSTRRRRASAACRSPRALAAGVTR